MSRMRRQRSSDRQPSGRPVDLGPPGPGRWLVRNSPADRVPSHGTTLFATTYAIDFVPVDDHARTAPVAAMALLRPDPPASFPGFGRPILSPISGRVVAARDGESDHAAYRGLPSLWYAVTQARRASRGWASIAGNHVLIQADPNILVAVCHLRRGSVRVAVGADVLRGEQLGECGNSGNSTQPHVHLQAMDDPDPHLARPLAISFGGRLPRNGTVVGSYDSARRA